MVRVIKKINNNVAVCVDGNGKELVAFGKGIGFPKIPYTITDLNKIDMTFYRVNTNNFQILKEIPEEILEVSSEIVKQAQHQIKQRMNPNIIFSLADHINFAIIRLNDYKEMELPFSYDVEQLYPVEYQIGCDAVKLINRKIKVNLPKNEAVAIAMHFVNSQEQGPLTVTDNTVNEIIDRTIKLIEQHFNVTVDRKEYAYNRFVMHLRYYLKRIQNDDQITDGSSQTLINTFREQEPKVYRCTKDIVVMIDDLLHTNSTDDEMFYLMIYVSRIVKKSLLEQNQIGGYDNG